MNNLIGVMLEEPDRSLFTIEQIKAWGAIDGTAMDEMIQEAIDGMVDLAQEELNISILPRTVQATYESTIGVVSPPYGPIIEIESVKDLSGDDMGYRMVGDLIYPAKKSGCVITYQAGHETPPKGIEQALKQAILTAINDREDNALGGVSRIPTSSRRKLMKYRRY